MSWYQNEDNHPERSSHIYSHGLHFGDEILKIGESFVSHLKTNFMSIIGYRDIDQMSAPF